MSPFICKHDSIYLISAPEKALLTRIDRLRQGMDCSPLDITSEQQEFPARFRTLIKCFYTEFYLPLQCQAVTCGNLAVLWTYPFTFRLWVSVLFGRKADRAKRFLLSACLSILRSVSVLASPGESWVSGFRKDRSGTKIWQLKCSPRAKKMRQS